MTVTEAGQIATIKMLPGLATLAALLDDEIDCWQVAATTRRLKHAVEILAFSIAEDRLPSGFSAVGGRMTGGDDLIAAHMPRSSFQK